MTKIINVNSCGDCPYIRTTWNSTMSETCACGNSFEGDERPRGEEYWLGGDALPGDRTFTNADIIQPWCKLPDNK